jgi:peptidoglycan/xylan/chitin deacetylase (PgdA/CDA1 family)
MKEMNPIEYTYRNCCYHLFILVLLIWFAGPAFTQQPWVAGTEVPVLCYHQVRPYTAKDGSEARAYTVTPENFSAQMKMLYDSGYHSILPDELYYRLTLGKPLPSKPVLITFDDNTLSQYLNAVPVLEKYGFRAVFFVMTVSLNKPNYMTTLQLKTLQQKGHVIGAHTWDHKNMRDYEAADWKIQLDNSFKTLESITGKPVRYFAYPFGAWSQKGIGELQKRGIKLAFILNTEQDSRNRLLTVRRLLVTGSWSAKTLHSKIGTAFLPKPAIGNS